MNWLQQSAHAWSGWIWPASWQLAVVVCLVAVCSALLRDASPRLRYGLWSLVLVKVFFPPTIGSPWSVGRWVVEPVRERLPNLVIETSHAGIAADNEPIRDTASGMAETLGLAEILFVAWLAGAAVFAVVVLGRYFAIVRRVTSQPTIDEGPLRVALEAISMRLGLRRVPELYAATDIGSPFLLGVLTPRIVIPHSLLDELSEDEIRDVLTHELVHWQRCDSWVGWLQFVAQLLFWFHPLVWWANHQMRHQRECVCDEMSLRVGRCNPKRYGETILRVLTAARGRSRVAGGLIGVFERGTKLQNRVETIMNYEPNRRQFGWPSRALIAGLALLLLPMNPSVSQDSAKITQAEKQKQAPKAPYPVIIQTIPEKGAIGVDPKLTTITVKFDRDMSGGMSWTGGPPLMPAIDKSRQAKWVDKRTCVLPVKLSRAKQYRVGINSKSYRNFRATDGTPTPPDVIAFVTEGATTEMKMRVKVPKITKISPDNGATDVKPTVKALRVTFDMPMGEGMSWTGGGDRFPKVPDGKRPRWTSDGKTCILPVQLEANKTYQLGLNSVSHNNFQSKHGVPIKPIVYTFKTSGK